MTGRLARVGVAAMSAASIVAGGAVVGAGTASAQSEDFVSSLELSVGENGEPVGNPVVIGMAVGTIVLLNTLDGIGVIDYNGTGCAGFGPCAPLVQLNWGS